MNSSLNPFSFVPRARYIFAFVRSNSSVTLCFKKDDHGAQTGYMGADAERIVCTTTN
jgi:hypothetical protein